ncbi:MAG: flagellar FliJ family protein [Synergistaceae bacterium]|jgi:flagellar export protein FliJ|nr:flagellar FliJ family protein [Synergistaceae bacterium]
MEQRIQRFSRILKLRENDRQAEQIVLAEERREEDAVLHRLDSLKSEKTQAIEDFSGGGERMVSRQEIWFQRQCIEVIEKHLDEGKENLNDVRRRIAGTENRLLERHRDVRVMEGYVDRLKTDARKAFFDVEQLELDDIAVTRYARFATGTGSSGTGLSGTAKGGSTE